ncbi:MAG: hypothetical protein U9N87_11595, partial [Planctomycetota bacterium]|nr:hypothetical protein [Planctomycetota bacterium]
KVNPEIIIDIVSSTSNAESSGDMSAEERKAKTLADWQQLPDVEAVRSGKVYCLDEDYISVPGPRFVLVLEKLEKLLHPEGE